jgi:hypothetical protein
LWAEKEAGCESARTTFQFMNLQVCRDIVDVLLQNKRPPPVGENSVTAFFAIYGLHFQMIQPE